MAFIRRRLSGKQDGTYSYQIIESYRAEGKIKQRVLYNLGPSPTIEAALDVQREELALYKNHLALSESADRDQYSKRFIEYYRRCAESIERNIERLGVVSSRIRSGT